MQQQTTNCLPRALPLTYVPYFKHNDSTRLQMACAHVRQAIPLLKCEKPFLKPDVETIPIGPPFLIKAPYDKCKCLGIIDNNIIIEDLETKYVTVLPLMTNLFESVYMPYNIIANPGQEYNKDEILAIANMVSPDDGHVMTGTNLLCGINIYHGYNYEDAIVISESAAKKLASTHYFAEDYKLYNQGLYPLEPPSSKTSSILYDLPKFVPLPGDIIKAGDPIIRIIEASSPSLLDKPKDETWTHDITVLQSKILFSKSFNETILKLFPQLWQEMQLLKKESKDLIKSIYEYVNTNQGQVSSSFERLAKEILLDKFVLEPAMVDIIVRVLGYYVDPAIIGDKLTNRHGNKGCIGKIVPDNEMPYIPQYNRKLDIIFNPLGILRRMNLGQLFELHVGRIKLHLESLYNAYITVKEHGEDNYSKDSYLYKLYEQCKTLMQDQDKLIALAKHLHIDPDITVGQLFNESYMMTHPFEQVFPQLKDNITFEDVKQINNILNISTKCDVVFDPKNPTDDVSPTSVGYMYVQKLYHRAVKKISARAVGKYSRRTLQPIHSKLSRAGQRFGEMETWALIAYDAVDLMKVMLGALSDNRKEKIKLLSRMIGVDISLEGLSDKCEISSVIDAYMKIAGINVKVKQNDELAELEGKEE